MTDRQDDDFSPEEYFEKVSVLAVNAFAAILKEQTREDVIVDPMEYVPVAAEKLKTCVPEICRLREEIFAISARLVHAFLNPSM